MIELQMFKCMSFNYFIIKKKVLVMISTIILKFEFEITLQMEFDTCNNHNF